MTESTARFALPFILPGQAQKEAFHNEALALVDAVLHCTIEGPLSIAPPPDPQPGQCWLVAAGAGGAWTNAENHVAVWTSGGWRFCAPVIGMLVYEKSSGARLQWSGTAWTQWELTAARFLINGQQVVGPRQSAVPSPSGGTIIDAEARTALTAVIATLMSHGLIE